MKSQITSHKLMLILLIVVFTVISALGCFEIVGRYIVDQDLYLAGDTFVDETRSNSFSVVLICSIIQVATLFSGKRIARVVGLLASAGALLLSVLYVPLCNASKQLIGGIVSYHCEITWLGYIAITFSLVILLFQIYTIKKQG